MDLGDRRPWEISPHRADPQASDVHGPLRCGLPHPQRLVSDGLRPKSWRDYEEKTRFYQSLADEKVTFEKRDCDCEYRYLGLAPSQKVEGWQGCEGEYRYIRPSGSVAKGLDCREAANMPWRALRQPSSARMARSSSTCARQGP